MQLVIGRIIRPHGVRGEVVVDVRTDSPAERFAVGSVLRDRPGGGRPADDRARCGPHQGRLLVTFDGYCRPGRGRQPARASCSAWTAPTVPEPTIRTSSTTTSWSACGRETPDGEHLGEVVRIDHAPASDLLVLRLPDGRTGPGPVRPGDRARGRHRRRPGRADPARGPASTSDGGRNAMRVDIITIFPEYFAPLDLSLLGRARLGRPARRSPCTTCASGPTTCTAPSTTPRTAAGPGMVMRPEPWGEALDAVLPDGAHLIVPSPAGVPFTQAMAHELAAEAHLVFACGRYEGIDQRVLDHAATRARVTRGLARRLRAVRRRGRGTGDLEAVGRLLPGRPRQRRLAGGGVARGRTAGGAGLHQAGAVARARGARGAALRRPRPDRPVAAGPGAAPYRRSAGPTCSPRCRRTSPGQARRGGARRGADFRYPGRDMAK